MEYIPVEKKTVGFLPKRGNLSKAFSLEVRYHSNTNIQRYVNHNMKNTRTPRRCPCFFWALPLLLTLYLPEILVKGFFFKILSPTFAISLKHGYIYSKKYSFEVFSQTMPPLFHFFPKTRWLTPDRPYIGWSGLPLLTRCCSLLLVCSSFCFLLCLLCIVYLHCVYLVYFFADHVLLTVACLCFFCYMVSSKKMLSELVDFALIVGACWNPFCRTVLVSKCAVNCNHNQC